jgi:hypothetical protein
MALLQSLGDYKNGLILCKECILHPSSFKMTSPLLRALMERAGHNAKIGELHETREKYKRMLQMPVLPEQSFVFYHRGVQVKKQLMLYHDAKRTEASIRIAKILNPRMSS